MKNKGYSSEDIAQITGLTLEEIYKLYIHSGIRVICLNGIYYPATETSNPRARALSAIVSNSALGTLSRFFAGVSRSIV